MDFARINTQRDAERGATYHVEFIANSEDKSGEALYHNGKPITIDVVGIEGQIGREAAARMVKSLDQADGRKGRRASNMSVAEILLSIDGKDEIKAWFYARLTTGWSNVFYLADDKFDEEGAAPEELAFSEGNAFMLYSTRPWIMEGLDNFLADKMNFMQKAVIE